MQCVADGHSGTESIRSVRENELWIGRLVVFPSHPPGIARLFLTSITLTNKGRLRVGMLQRAKRRRMGGRVIEADPITLWHWWIDATANEGTQRGFTSTFTLMAITAMGTYTYTVYSQTMEQSRQNVWDACKLNWVDALLALLRHVSTGGLVLGLVSA